MKLPKSWREIRISSGNLLQKVEESWRNSIGKKKILITNSRILFLSYLLMVQLKDKEKSFSWTSVSQVLQKVRLIVQCYCRPEIALKFMLDWSIKHLKLYITFFFTFSILSSSAFFNGFLSKMYTFPGNHTFVVLSGWTNRLNVVRMRNPWHEVK